MIVFKSYAVFPYLDDEFNVSKAFLINSCTSKKMTQSVTLRLVIWYCPRLIERWQAGYLQVFEKYKIQSVFDLCLLR